jgi:putative phosphoribosyl transferase
MKRFRDRTEAGTRLGERLMAYAGRSDVLVLALPRGGVPVAFEVARTLKVPLDVFLVRKLGVPGQEELAMGAIASAGIRVLNEEVVCSLQIPPEIIERVAQKETAELERRERAYRAGRFPLEVRGKTVILVDDGLATGSTMRAAVQAVREREPARVVVAVPTASDDACAEFRLLVDEMVCLMTPQFFYAVGLWYENFAQTSDEEVRELLDRAAKPEPSQD